MPDPSSLTLTQTGEDILVDWTAPVMPSATHVDVFRRPGTSTLPFDPSIDPPIARLPIGTTEYLDVGLPEGDYAYQVFPVEVTGT